MKFYNVAKKFGAGVVLSVVSMGTALAAVPLVVGTTLTGLQTDALAAIDLVWPVMLVVFGGLLLMKVVKKAASKI